MYELVLKKINFNTDRWYGMNSINKRTIKNNPWSIVQQMEFKKMILQPIFALVCSDVIKIPVMNILNKNPRTKEIVKKIYFRFFLKLIGIANNNTYHYQRNLLIDTSITHKSLMAYVLRRNTTNIDSNEEINSFVIALKGNDFGRLNARIAKKNYRNIIVACYLNQLRRYPSENDIVLWSAHLTQGATLFTILNSLKNSPEFLHCGIFYLE